MAPPTKPGDKKKLAGTGAKGGVPTRPTKLTGDAEDIRALSAEMDNLIATVDNWTGAQKAAAAEIAESMRYTREQATEFAENLDKLGKQTQDAQARADAHRAKAIVLNAANDMAEEAREIKKAENQEKLVKFYKEQEKSRRAAHEAVKEIQKEEINNVKKLEIIQDEAARVKKKRQEEFNERTKKSANNILDFAVGSANAAKDAFIETLKTAGPALTALAVFKPELGPMRVLGALETEMKKYDDNWRSVVKNVGTNTTLMRDVFDQAFDPISHAMAEFGENAEKMAEEGQIAELNLYDIGLTSADVASAMNTLVGSVATFRTELTKGDKASATSMLNMVAGLKKLGVAEADSGKSIDGMVKAMGRTPAMATKSTTKLLNLAKSLNMNAGKAVKDFTALMPDLVAYGDRAEEVFARMAAQANATGIEIGNLNSFAKKMDTFKGATEIAQRFNAQMGGMYLSAIDLAKADLPDKITMIQEAMARSGKSFDDFGRRGKLAITAALGLDDTEKAARILRGREEFEEAKKGIDITTMSQKELREKVTETMTQLELQTKSISRHGAGFSAWTKRTRKVAIQGADAITAGFKRSKEETQSAEQAAVGMLFAYKGMEGTAGALTARLKELTAATSTAAAAAGLTVGVGALMGAGSYAALEEGSEEKRHIDKLWEEKKKGYRAAIEAYAKDKRLDWGTHLQAKAGLSEEGKIKVGAMTGDPQSGQMMALYKLIRKGTIDDPGGESPDQIRREQMMAFHLVQELKRAGLLHTVGNITLEVDGEAMGEVSAKKIKEHIRKQAGL